MNFPLYSSGQRLSDPALTNNDEREFIVVRTKAPVDHFTTFVNVKPA